MYERSASVLEKYIEQTLIYNSELKENYSYYKELIGQLENYQNASEKEITYDEEYKTVLSKVEDIQRKQKEITKYSIELENKRNRLFSNILKSAEEIESELLDIEKTLKTNSEKLIELRGEIIKELKDAAVKKAALKEIQETMRTENRNFRKSLRKITDSYNSISDEQIEWTEEILKDEEKLEEDIIEIMLQNGKNEKVPFNEDVIKSGAVLGIDIAKRQCEAYIFIYKQTSKLIDEISQNKVKMETRKKAFFSTDAKIRFLEAQKEYLNHFLDNERLTAIHSLEEHDKSMDEAMAKFNVDINKINDLYNLLIKETKGKATKKDFENYYDISYYREVEEKELKFQEETKKLGIGGAVSPEYWRREGLRSIYDTFNKIVSPAEKKYIENSKINTANSISASDKDDYSDNDLEEDDNLFDETEKDTKKSKTSKSRKYLYNKEKDEVNKKEYNDINDKFDEEDDDNEDNNDEDYDADDEKKEIDDETDIFKDEYKYKDRIKKLLEQNNMAKVMSEYENLEKENKEYEDEEDDDEDDDELFENKSGKHSMEEDSKKKGRHSDDESSNKNIFSKLKNIFDKSKDEEDEDYEDEDDEEDDYDDSYDDDDDEDDDDIIEEPKEDKDEMIDKELENMRRYKERMNRFDEKMKEKLAQNPKLRR